MPARSLQVPCTERKSGGRLGATETKQVSTNNLPVEPRLDHLPQNAGRSTIWVLSRRRLDEEMVLAGLRNWSVSRNRNPAKLAKYAREMGVFDTLKAAMEVLL